MIMYIYIKYKPLIKEKKRDTYADRQIIGNLDTYVSDFFFFLNHPVFRDRIRA